MTELDDNKALVRRHLERAINERRPELWDEIMDEHFDLHHPLVEPGRANYRIANGRLVEAWFQEDDLGFQQQVFG